MAKRRKARTRTVYRRRASPIKRRRSRSRKSGAKIRALQPEAMAYGASREAISSLISALTNKIPLAGFADELGMGLTTYLVAKNTKGFLRKSAIAGLTVENARVGEELMGKTISSLVGRTTATGNATNAYVYG